VPTFGVDTFFFLEHAGELGIIISKREQKHGERSLKKTTQIHTKTYVVT
jgi:hypothetical protein